MGKIIFTPVKLVQPEQWPFELLVVDAHGNNIIREERFAYPGSSKSVADVMACVDFINPMDRAVAIVSNATQVARLEEIVHAINSHERLVSALRSICGDVAGDWQEKFAKCQAIATNALTIVEGGDA